MATRLVARSTWSIRKDRPNCHTCSIRMQLIAPLKDGAPGAGIVTRWFRVTTLSHIIGFQFDAEVIAIPRGQFGWIMSLEENSAYSGHTT